MTNEQEGDEEFDFDQHQMKVLALLPKAGACIAFISAMYMAVSAFQYRDRLFHRLIFGLACHAIHCSSWQIYGSWAIPADKSFAWGARGTQATCSAQGFAMQFSAFSSFLYYTFLSFYSYAAVRHNFVAEKYLWVEKWIHLFVHSFPLASAIYLLKIEAFNAGNSKSVCYIDSYPRHCGSTSNRNIPCERGPENITIVAGIWCGIPTGFVLIFPTLVMIALYYQVRQNQRFIRIKANQVAKQAALYLGALYCAFAFVVAGNTLNWYGHDNIYFISLFASVNFNLFGAWALVVYLYFRVTTAPKIASSQEFQVPESSSTTCPKEARTSSLTRSASELESQRTMKHQCSFNIFDGTNAQGDYAEYVFDGDSDDERADRRESVLWQDIQEHV